MLLHRRVEVEDSVAASRSGGGGRDWSDRGVSFYRFLVPLAQDAVDGEGAAGLTAAVAGGRHGSALVTSGTAGLGSGYSLNRCCSGHRRVNERCGSQSYWKALGLLWNDAIGYHSRSSVKQGCLRIR